MPAAVRRPPLPETLDLRIDGTAACCYNERIRLFLTACVLAPERIGGHMSRRRCRKMPDIQNLYETVFILSTKLGDDGIKAAVQKFKDLISAHGTVDNVDEWGKRRLAYPIRKENEGYYTLISFTSPASFTKELDRVYNITDGVLRSLIVKRVTPVAKKQEAPKPEAAKTAAAPGPEAPKPAVTPKAEAPTAAAAPKAEAPTAAVAPKTEAPAAAAAPKAEAPKAAAAPKAEEPKTGGEKEA